MLASGILLLDPETFELPDEPEKMVGSIMIFRAKTIGTVWEIIRSDVYWTGGVVSLCLMGVFEIFDCVM